MISVVGSLWPPGSVEFSDSDEEDERVGPGIASRHDEGLTSFPVDSWEETWDDSDAPVSQEVLSPFKYAQTSHMNNSNHLLAIIVISWMCFSS